MHKITQSILLTLFFIPSLTFAATDQEFLILIQEIETQITITYDAYVPVCILNKTSLLTYGARNENVRCLQKLLNTDPETRVALEGPGSPGNETNYYGVATRSAVAKFFLKYPNSNLVDKLNSLQKKSPNLDSLYNALQGVLQALKNL